MYLCIYDLYVCMYIRKYVYMMHMYVCICVCMYIRMCGRMYISLNLLVRYIAENVIPGYHLRHDTCTRVEP